MQLNQQQNQFQYANDVRTGCRSGKRIKQAVERFLNGLKLRTKMVYIDHNKGMQACDFFPILKPG
jgi:hypothetical protein